MLYAVAACMRSGGGLLHTKYKNKVNIDVIPYCVCCVCVCVYVCV